MLSCDVLFVNCFYHGLIVFFSWDGTCLKSKKWPSLYHRQITVKTLAKCMSESSLIAPNFRNTKQLSETNNLFIFVVSLSFLLLPMEKMAFISTWVYDILKFRFLETFSLLHSGGRTKNEVGELKIKSDIPFLCPRNHFYEPSLPP